MIMCRDYRNHKVNEMRNSSSRVILAEIAYISIIIYFHISSVMSSNKHTQFNAAAADDDNNEVNIKDCDGDKNELLDEEETYSD